MNKEVLEYHLNQLNGYDNVALHIYYNHDRLFSRIVGKFSYGFAEHLDVYILEIDDNYSVTLELENVEAAAIDTMIALIVIQMK